LTAVNSRKNTSGGEIKVIIASEVASEGLDFKNIRQVHILEPWYNMNRIEQIIGRAVRNLSHSMMNEMDRNVTVYLHAILIRGNQAKVASIDGRLLESIDLEWYRRSNIKQLHISDVERLLKQNAFDCALNKSRLVFQGLGARQLKTSVGKLITYDPSDVNNSRQCDFVNCDIRCAVESSAVINDGSISATYDRNMIASAEASIQKLFSHKVVVPLLSLTTDLLTDDPNIRSDVVAIATSRMVRTKKTFKGLLGMQGFLLKRSDKLVFQPMNIADKKIGVKERVSPSTTKVMDVNIALATGKEFGKGAEDEDDTSTKTSAERLAESVIFIFQSLSQVSNETIEMNIVYDMVIDMADKDSFLEASQISVGKPPKGEKDLFANASMLRAQTPFVDNITAAMERSMLFMLQKKYAKGLVLCLHNGEIYSVSSDQPYLIAAENEKTKLLKYVSAETTVALNNVLNIGFSDIDKNGVYKFKIFNTVEPKKDEKGSVCGTSSLKSDVLVKVIKNANSTFMRPGKNKKELLCLAYEYILRQKAVLSGLSYKRPAIGYMLQENEKQLKQQLKKQKQSKKK
jgi:hypothetical protein